MPVRKSTIAGPDMQAYYTENPNFQTAVNQLETTQPQEPARIYIPGGDRIIGDGLERITVNQAEVQATFEDIRSQLEEEAQPVLDALSQIEG
jgi:sn-glycerol 3-phosphate transport system substrate-binding protein